VPLVLQQWLYFIGSSIRSLLFLMQGLLFFSSRLPSYFCCISFDRSF
jgi:hypothetical protein